MRAREKNPHAKQREYLNEAREWTVAMKKYAQRHCNIYGHEDTYVTEDSLRRVLRLSPTEWTELLLLKNLPIFGAVGEHGHIYNLLDVFDWLDSLVFSQDAYRRVQKGMVAKPQ